MIVIIQARGRRYRFTDTDRLTVNGSKTGIPARLVRVGDLVAYIGRVDQVQTHDEEERNEVESSHSG